jgi:hypothetical protein
LSKPDDPPSPGLPPSQGYGGQDGGQTTRERASSSAKASSFAQGALADRTADKAGKDWIPILCSFDNRLKSGFGCGNLIPPMSLAELKDNVMALPESERHDFVVWLNRLEQDYGDIPGEALAEMAAEVWEQDDRPPLPRLVFNL